MYFKTLMHTHCKTRWGFFLVFFFLLTFLTVKVDWAPIVVRGEKPQNVYGIVVKYILLGNL